MTRSIVLHIGAPKAGSTYLQRVMLKNRDRLAIRGIAYPHRGTGHPGNGMLLWEAGAEHLGRLFQGDVQTLVLSHEDLFALGARRAPMLSQARAAGIAVQRVVFLRPWSEFCVGDMSQHLKQHFEAYLSARQAFRGMGFEAFARWRARAVDPVALFRRWDRQVPDPPLVIAPHRRIAETIEAILGAPALDWEVSRSLANPSLRLTDCEAIATMIADRSVPDAAVRQAFHAAHHRTADSDPARHPDRMSAVDAMFAGRDAALLAAYGFDNRPAFAAA